MIHGSSGRRAKIKIRNASDFYAGLLFLCFGLVAVVTARNYPMGTSRHMGPGYFPTVLGAGLVLLGLVITVRGLWSSGEALKLTSLRPLLLVCAGVLAFALLVRPLGVVPAVVALVCISSFGGEEFRLREVIISSLVLAGMVVGVFVYGLGLPYNLFWAR
jgi:putative tricarboxylic transport membrane protein